MASLWAAAYRDVVRLGSLRCCHLVDLLARPTYLDRMRFVAFALVFAACTDDIAVFTDRDTFGAGDSLAGEVDINDADTFEVDTIDLDVPLADLDGLDGELADLDLRDGELADIDVGPDTEEGLLND